MTIDFVRPEVLGLLVFLPAWVVLTWSRTERDVLHPRVEAVRRSGTSRLPGSLVSALPIALRMLTLAALLVALAHPQTTRLTHVTSLKGKSFALAVDISTSMLATDMDNDSTRMSVARGAAVRFAEERTLDELSLVAFAGQAVTRVPHTRDPRLIVSGVNSLEPQLVLDGTDISAAVLWSLSSLLESENEDQVIVLLTDGAHNGQGVTPLTTARGAAAMGVRIYSIALVGVPDVEGMSPLLRANTLRRVNEVESRMETVLSAISDVTGGRYFRATGEAELDSIYRTISTLESPTEEVIEVPVRESLRLWPLLAALMLIGLDALLRGSRWSVVP